MTERSEEKESAKVTNRRVHMANERTFLAWIRTSIGIMAFGFVVEKFALFVKQISFFFGKAGHPNWGPSHLILPLPGGHPFWELFWWAWGPLWGCWPLFYTKKQKDRLMKIHYHPSLLLDILLALSVLAVGIFLIIYLIHSL